MNLARRFPALSVLSKEQRAILGFLWHFFYCANYAASVGDVGAAFGWTEPAARRRIDALRLRGLVASSLGLPRTLHLTDDGRSVGSAAPATAAFRRARSVLRWHSTRALSRRLARTRQTKLTLPRRRAA